MQRLLNESEDDRSFFVSPLSGDQRDGARAPFIAPDGSLDADSIGQLILPAYSSDDLLGAAVTL